ncbi:hypothetical protein DDL28_11955 [Staphylococcus aureus]|uniref:Uncharacterized protein n=2 Tax=Staphylococcus aureus TaxID=1280 RepID=A0A0H3K0H9_STAAM|nr:hypothetical protein B7473_13295 [Staphylococcus aureus]EEV67582.1 conserved hypothetical protein [Staphylococcus aureus A9719]EFT84511.1 hypothetical protein CGSSa03_14605 [Staphylococcus aureus subsp. aureus CGS03]EJU82369.1 hypothetical protein HMPREF1384_01743 [Staphylococcus aureus subsp. aureus CM05]EOR89974.1 hypothetical protein L230_12724 [Staphylococcus aureus subsp. aureus CBD-635]KAA2217952.1 hypothetical protein F1583_12610 [Staphylococcus sp. 53017]KAA2227080.1 hypothetical p
MIIFRFKVNAFFPVKLCLMIRFCLESCCIFRRHLLITFHNIRSKFIMFKYISSKCIICTG